MSPPDPSLDFMMPSAVKFGLTIKTCLFLPSSANSYLCRSLHLLKRQAFLFLFYVFFYLPFTESPATEYALVLLLVSSQGALSESMTTDNNLALQPCDIGLRASCKLRYLMKQQLQNIKHNLEVVWQADSTNRHPPTVRMQRCTFLWQ